MASKIEISTEYIKLDSAMKLSGAVSIGSDAKYAILEGAVSVNGEQEFRRGRKLYPGDKFLYDGKVYEII